MLVKDNPSRLRSGEGSPLRWMALEGPQSLRARQDPAPEWKRHSEGTTPKRSGASKRVRNAKRRVERAARRRIPLRISRPWEAAGVSRATWYARCGRAGQMSPTPHRVPPEISLVIKSRASTYSLVTNLSSLAFHGDTGSRFRLAVSCFDRTASVKTGPPC